MISEAQNKAITQATNILREHFDTCQILCTSHDGNNGSTDYAERGFGNILARYGHALVWTEAQRDSFDEKPEPPDGSEAWKQ